MKKITIQLLALFSFCQTLGRKKSEQSKKILAEIQEIFSDDKGWEIEVGGQLATDLILLHRFFYFCVLIPDWSIRFMAIPRPIIIQNTGDVHTLESFTSPTIR